MLGAAMESEIREQPKVLHENSSAYFESAKEAIQGKQFKMVLLVARGSSDHAALYARYLFEIVLGIPVILAAPSVLTKYGVRVRYENCLAIGISQSGAAPDVSEVISALRQDGHTTIGITNTAGSRLELGAESTIFLNAGIEKSVAATKTYSASLLVILQIARALGAELPDPGNALPNDEWVSSCNQIAQVQSGWIVRSTTLFALARGYSFCTAFETALKLMECALIPCKPYSSADFQHGPKALAGPGSTAIVYGDPLPFLEIQGCHSIVAPRPFHDLPDYLQPIWDIVFGQWLALSAARARGLDPDDPQFLDKVTETL